MRALITGVSGQDGSYLTELLLDHNYEIFGIIQPGFGPGCLAGLPAAGRVRFFEADVTDYSAVSDAVRISKPDECYHLAAQTIVTGVDEFATMRTNIGGAHCVLAALAQQAPECRVFYAGSSEMFGAAAHSPQSESTPMLPRSLYGVSKVGAYSLMAYYRQERGLYGCCGILYNHESPRRSPNFISRKVTRGAAAIRRGEQNELRLGNLNAVRDWGDARDYVIAMWQMLQQPAPDDYVIATGVPRTVTDLVDIAFTAAGLNWRDHVVIDPAFYRAVEAIPLVGSAKKVRTAFGWAPTREFAATIQEMVECDMQRPSAQ